MTGLIRLTRFFPAAIATLLLLILVWPVELLLGILFFPIKAFMHERLRVGMPLLRDPPGSGRGTVIGSI